MAIGVIFILANMVFTGSAYTISACSVELVGLNYDRRQNDGYRIWQWPGLQSGYALTERLSHSCVNRRVVADA
jgi:hypothetical protein